MSDMTDTLTGEALEELRIAQQPLFPGGPRHPSRKNAYFRALAEAYESGVLAVRVCRATPADDLRAGLLREVLDCQKKHYGNGSRLHMAMIKLAARIDAALAQKGDA